jgi:hypothetical protein
MRKQTSISIIILLIICVLSGCNGGSGNKGSGVTFIKADHSHLNISDISQSDLDSARALRMSLDHASVGGNILGGMNALQTSDATRYTFSNWHWRNRGNPGWQAKVDQFVTWVSSQQSNDVFQMKLCYIDEGASFTYYRDKMQFLESTYPTKRFIWWTMPICTSGSDNSLRQTFNNLVRTYCAANNKPLFDIADIESHDSSGSTVKSEGFEAMAAEWSSDGGHLNAAGAARMAKAMWWIMVQLAKK